MAGGEGSPVVAAIGALVVIVPVVVGILWNDKVSPRLTTAIVVAVVGVLVTLCWTIFQAT